MQGARHVGTRKCAQHARSSLLCLLLWGLGRVDLLIDSETKTVYFNEVNPLPGSLYAHNWRAAGVSTVELVKDLIQLAEERHAEQSKTTTSFDSSFLRQF